jgi:hypothetical protein
MKQPNLHLSELVAHVMAGAWRAELSPLGISAEELSTVTPYLLGYGGAEMLWRRVRGELIGETSAGTALHEAHRYSTLLARMHETEIARVFQVLAEAGISALLVKGWGVARHYPEPGLRPYVDIDVFVDPAAADRANAVLIENDCEKYFVEVHAGPKHLDAEPIEDWFQRSTLVELDQVPIRLPAHEDHFRALCVHWLHHGAIRAAGLCDIALFLEKFGATMDWELCLRGKPQRAGWVVCAVGLAQNLLGADLSAMPIADAGERLPRWMKPSVLRIWADPRGRGAIIPPPLHASLSHPVRAARELRSRWPPNPIHATLEVNGAFNDLPRLPYQAANFLARTGRFLAQLPRNLLTRPVK